MSDSEPRTPLGGDLTVVDLSTGIPGNYCGKLLIDGGADVVKIEPPLGDPLRARRILDDPAPDPTVGSVLFQFLSSSKASVVADPLAEADRALVRELVRGADAVIWSEGSAVAELDEFRPDALRRLAPRAIIVTITPFGLINEPAPPANEFTLQAMAGGSVSRGRPDREPLAVGGSCGDWITGMFAATGLLTAHIRARATGVGELVDVSMLDAMHLTQNEFFPTKFVAAGKPPRVTRARIIPMIHPTTDGYVGFQITTGQQWQDFSAMIDKPDWAEDATLTRFDARIARYEEVNATIDEWTTARSTAEIVEIASLFRLPVAPVANGKTIQTLEQAVARGWYVNHPAGFTHPEVPYTFHGAVSRRGFGSSPILGGDTERFRATSIPAMQAMPTGMERPLPFEGLRIADFTAFWAGPIIAHYYALMGADVVHIEATVRPDGIRAATLRYDMSDGWWDASPTFAGTNTNKRDLALDMSTAPGQEIARRLIAECDIVIDNFSTRVMPQWGLDYDSLKALKPDLIVVRAPGFGISGPWADRVAYATTVEQASGASWVTGFPDDRPENAGGSMDPTAGSHAAFAILLALEHRRRTGKGVLLEVPQFTSAMNVFAEQVLEYSSTGRILGRMANRAWTLAPQGTYRTRDVQRRVSVVPADDWVAISVETDDQWRALCEVIGADDLANDPSMKTVDGRREAHDQIDAAITAWTSTRDAGEVVAAILAAGVPCGNWVQSYELIEIPQVIRRQLYETVDHPVLGPMPIIGYPVRYEHGPQRLHRRRAPLLGEHNREILEELGLTTEEIDALETSAVIGTKAKTLTPW